MSVLTPGHFRQLEAVFHVYYYLCKSTTHVSCILLTAFTTKLPTPPPNPPSAQVLVLLLHQFHPYPMPITSIRSGARFSNVFEYDPGGHKRGGSVKKLNGSDPGAYLRGAQFLVNTVHLFPYVGSQSYSTFAFLFGVREAGKNYMPFQPLFRQNVVFISPL